MEILQDKYLNGSAREYVQKSYKVLYIGSDSKSLKLIKGTLKKLFSKLFTASNSKEGLKAFEVLSPDIVVIDISMQNLDGTFIVKKIRKRDKEIPIFIISLNTSSNSFIKSLKFGVDGYLTKPINNKRFEKEIKKVIEKLIYKDNVKNSLKFLGAYLEATNQSSIVSKTDPDGVITYVNKAFCEISGYSVDELIGKPHNIVRYPDNPKELFKNIWNEIKVKKRVWRGVIKNMSKDGKSYYVDSLIMPVLDKNGKIIEYISLRNDITEIMSSTKQLNEAIKNIPNPIVVYMKLDDFDTIEEFYDNETLTLIQNRVRDILEDSFKKFFNFDKLYYLENGEYVFILNKDLCKNDNDYILDKLQTLQKEIKKKELLVENDKYIISLLISVVYSGTKRFESARLGVKKLIKDRGFFRISNNLASIEHKKAKENMKIVHMIKSALTDSRVVSYFQPIIDNKTKKIIKYESLVRLIDDNNEIILPSKFLDTAKKSNLYFQITKEVLKHSFEKLRLYKVDISINLSAIDIEQDTTRELILSLVEQHKTLAKNMVFELLEDEEVKNFVLVRDFIKKIKSYGVKIAIDDFGVGYSNYERLLKYQPDILKIDGSLIENIESDDYSYLSALKSIVSFAKEQNIKTVAEFIENEAKFNIVRDLGIDYSQGYYFGRPEPLILNKID